MPGGRRQYIPTHCPDATGRKVPVFNPAVRPKQPPRDTDFTLAEWNDLLRAIYPTRIVQRGWLTLIPLAVILSIPIYVLAKSGIPLWQAIPFATFPLWALALLVFCFGTLSAKTLGVAAFVDVHEDTIVREMLKRNRCPSCAYRLPYATPDCRATCSECSAVWRSRNFRTSPLQPPSPCTSPAPSQAPPR